MFFKTYWLLGQNARNLNYIKEYNTKVAKKLADSKLKTKNFLQSNNIATPKTLKILENKESINNKIFDDLEPPFVIKPNGGFGGKWILIIDKIDANWNYITNDKQVFSKNQLVEHCINIIDWFFSLSWNRDKVVIEHKIELDEEIELLGKFGLPDIRIIVFNMIPVIAMLRVPTAESKWKANLHAGACWVWIDIWTGRLTYIAYKWSIIKSIPWIWDVRGLKLPKWEEALNLAVKVQQKTKIWYLWVDIVLDKKEWPLILEINIRPGLEVQLANLAPLKDRLEKVEWIFVNSVEKWVRLGRDLFSGEIEEKIKNISWKKVVGSKEYLFFEYKDKKYKYLANIKPSNSKSYIDKTFAKEVLKIDDKQIEKWYIKFDCKILEEHKKIRFFFKDLWSVNIILGLNALKWFLIDPFKYKKWELPPSNLEEIKNIKNSAIKKNYEKILEELDKNLISIDKKLLILKNITPINIKEEKQKFIESKWEYIPKLEYKELKIDFNKLKEELNKIEISDIPLASIFKRKKDEILDKINFLQAFWNKEDKSITHYSTKLFGESNSENLQYALEIINSKIETKEETEFLSFEEIIDTIKKFNHIYNIKISLKKAEKSARFTMSGDILYIRPDAKVWKKELRSIIAHEIEGHYLRKINWRKIKYNIFSHWTAKYLEIDEWIAIFNQNRFLNKSDRKYYSIYERYYFLNYALNHSYKELLKEMEKYYKQDYEKIFNFILRLKRATTSFDSPWVFCKDNVYLNWYLKILDYIENSGKLEDLYIWKIALEDLSEIKNSYFIKFDFSDIITPFFIKN